MIVSEPSPLINICFKGILLFAVVGISAMHLDATYFLEEPVMS